MKINKLMFVIGTFALVVNFIGGCSQQVDPVKEAAAVRQVAAEKHAASALAHYKSSLLDPDSAKFKELYVLESTVTVSKSVSTRVGEKLLTLCGQVNAKNAFGGYTGYKWFFVRKNLELDTFWGFSDSEAEARFAGQYCAQQSDSLATYDFKKVADIPNPL